MQEFDSPLASLLDPGEKLLWSGQPKQGVRLQASDAIMIPFSLMWGGFAIFWEAGVLGIFEMPHQSHPEGSASIVAWIFPLWGIPFVVIGLYMIFGRFFYDAAVRKKTWYGLTDRRLIVVKSFFNRGVTSFDHDSLTNLNLVERGDGSGDILFGSPDPGQFSRQSRRYVVPGFYLLPDARQIYNQIRQTRQHAKVQS